MLNLPVSEIMNDHPIKVKSDVSIRNVAHLLLRYRINGILVIDPARPEELAGVFTTADLLALMDTVFMNGTKKMQALSAVAERPVSDFVNRNFLSLQKDDNAAKAVALMHKRDALTIPVYDGNTLVGVVGRHDIINIAFA
ncbi:MAG: CBS domain-containing protein [Candidatus Omnitrophica bacterium]|nr:CBS domain-containing protein [Candidatus Omnitrophota bacterium]